MENDLYINYDVIVIGTGFPESLIAAAAARIGKKVLHLDKNPYYGGQWASFSLSSLQEWVDSYKTPADTNISTDLCTEPLSSKCAGTELQDSEIWRNLTNRRGVYQNVKLEFHNLEPQRNYIYTKKCEENDSKVVVEEKHSQESSEVVVEEKLSKESSEVVVEEKFSQESCKKTECQDDTTNHFSIEGLLKQNRKFNIDLAPKLLFCKGPMVELLISSNVARYLEFKCLTRILTWMETSSGQLVAVPCTREQVKSSCEVSNIERWQLMKFLRFCHCYQEHKEQWEGFTKKSFKDFLINEKLTPTLIHFILNAIAMVSSDESCEVGLAHTKLFLNSLGRYGDLPFLFPLYGAGEIPQAFCRLCAVFEGIYMLRKEVEGAIVDQEVNRVVSVVSEGQRFQCKNVVMESSYIPQEFLKEEPSNIKSISRAVLITDRSLMTAEKESLTLLRLMSDKGVPVTVLEVGFGAGVCPKDCYLVHLTCEGLDAEADFSSVVEKLFGDKEVKEPEAKSKPNIAASFYFNRIQNYTLVDDLPSNLYVCFGPNSDLDYDEAIDEAKSIFQRIFPDDEFLPRAPDPEEIVFEGDAAKEGDTFDQELQEEMDIDGTKTPREEEAPNEEQMKEEVPCEEQKKEEAVMDIEEGEVSEANN